MKLIVGLGNPGFLYRNSRHNIGFQVIRALAKTYKLNLRKDKGISVLSSKVKIARETVVLALPLSFMNLSGTVVADLVKKYRIDLTHLLVVCDDLDLEFGRLRIRGSGSSGGHKGLESIIDALVGRNFARLRLGIGRPSGGLEAADYVLLPFTRKQRGELKGIIKRACACCEIWLGEGTVEAMNIFNQRSRVDESCTF